VSLVKQDRKCSVLLQRQLLYFHSFSLFTVGLMDLEGGGAGGQDIKSLWSTVGSITVHCDIEDNSLYFIVVAL
jgi:hypothetical protein